MKWVSCICWNFLRIEYFVYFCNNNSFFNNFIFYVVNRCEDLSMLGLIESVLFINLFWVNIGCIVNCSVILIKLMVVSKKERFIL